MTKLGIIPAAGNASRFGGVAKELLPISDSETLLSRTLDFLEDIPTDENIIVSNTDKGALHWRCASGRAQIILQNDFSCDLWGAIKATIPYSADMNYLAMPDTYTPAMSYYESLPEHDIVIGLFETTQPERYGVFTDGVIYDKDAQFKGSIRLAWGFIGWSRAVVSFWQKAEIASHTQAFNMALSAFGYKSFRMPFYFDISCMQDYKGLLSHV